MNNKKSYSSPKVVYYGAIMDLTQGAFSDMMDSDMSETLEVKMKMDKK